MVQSSGRAALKKKHSSPASGVVYDGALRVQLDAGKLQETNRCDTENG
jgi:hypothetical protein